MRDLETLLQQYHELDKKLDVNTSCLQDIVDSVKSIDLVLNENTRQLDKNTFQLEIHIAGVAAAQANLGLLRQEFALYKEIVEKRFTENEKPRVVIKGVLWLVGSLSALGGLFLLAREIFQS